MLSGASGLVLEVIEGFGDMAWERDIYSATG
jgi:hypothetical protein